MLNSNIKRQVRAKSQQPAWGYQFFFFLTIVQIYILKPNILKIDKILSQLSSIAQRAFAILFATKIKRAHGKYLMATSILVVLSFLKPIIHTEIYRKSTYQRAQLSFVLAVYCIQTTSQVNIMFVQKKSRIFISGC